ncbi:MAG: hypothetical protein IJ580_08340 [Prevotella sp.]|nr:hypothetical protein [Prevotella sp.]MBR1556529.1 hypothetical protein [Prevotella sp.]
MKKIKIMLAAVAAMFALGAQAQKQALLVGYSQTDNVYEDENIKAELVRLSLKITNKTNKPLFIDRSSSFYYINDEAICLDEKRDDTSHTNYQPLAPKSDTWVSTLINPIRGKYDAGGGNYGKGAKANYQTDLQLQVMDYMETMRYELANNDKKSCTSIHLTGDESFMKVKVYIKYDTKKRSSDEKEAEEHTFTISTWVSDMILSKYYIQDQDKVKRTNAVNIQGRMTDIMHVFADRPFEYDEDSSPIDIYETTFGKGQFIIYRLGASAAEKEGRSDKEEKPGVKPGRGKDKKADEEMKSNFEERSKARQVLIWEGETTNWSQALQDSYERYLIEDGENPKKARNIAKNKAKELKNEQTLKK